MHEVLIDVLRGSHPTVLSRTVILTMLLTFSVCIRAGDLAGLTLPEAIDALQSEGLRVVYSSGLVRDDMRVIEPPRGVGLRAQLEEIVRPHGLAVNEGPNGILLIVRSSPPLPASAPPAPPDVDVELEAVIVEASRYALVRFVDDASTRVTAAELETVPNLGEDPLRALARLPGTASNDFSAKLSVRGGEPDETLVRLDGMRLHNPFHLKDFQSVFSAVDASFVDTIDVYTGAVPVNLGDHMSGVIDVRSIEVTDRPQREISLSVFNAAALLSGELNAGDTDWLVAARRGNLDLVLDWTQAALGTPRYMDAYGRMTHRVSDKLAVSGNFLMLNDDIRLNDTDLEERAQAEYRDRYGWLTFEYAPGDAWSGRLIASRTQLDSTRSGSADQPGVGSGWLDDHRAHAINAIALDTRWRSSEALEVLLGGEWRHVSGSYRYRDEADFDLILLSPGVSPMTARSRDEQADPRGDIYGLYSSARVAPFDSLIVDAGVRWDRSTLPRSYDAELSPRMSLLYAFNERTRLRAGWGRYAQMQNIDDLQIADGVVAFFPAQRSEQWVLSAEHLLVDRTLLRFEVYRKNYRELRPRFENLLNTTALLPELKPDRVRLAPDRATAEGAEISLRHVTGDPLLWWVSYAWSRVQDDFGRGDVARSWDQTHAVSAGLGWRKAGWQLSVAASYHAGWPRTTLELVADEPMPIAVADRNAAHLSDYVDLDLRAAREFQFSGATTLTVFFELSNVFDRTNECCVEYEFEDEDGEQFLELERIASLPLLPSLGFTFRF